MLSSATPSPASSTAVGGSPASSPHTPTQRPFAAAPATVSCDKPQDRGLRPGQQRSQPLVPALGRHRVLGQVVRADREEVDVLGEAGGGQRRRGDLDHDPELDRCVDPGIGPRALEHRPRRSDLLERRHHRQHHLERMLGRHAQDRAELSREHVLALQRRGARRGRRGTGWPPAACGSAGSGLSAPASSVRTTSTRPSRARAIWRSVSSCSSSSGNVGAVQEQELGTEQADPLRPKLDRARGLLRPTRGSRTPRSARRRGSRPAHAPARARHARSAGPPARGARSHPGARPPAARRKSVPLPRRAARRSPRRRLSTRFPQADHGGQAERPGQDRGVRRGRAVRGGDSGHPRGIERRRVGGSQLAGDDDSLGTRTGPRGRRSTPTRPGGPRRAHRPPVPGAAARRAHR